MPYFCKYSSPLGKIVLASDAEALCGLWFEGQRYFASTLEGGIEREDFPVLKMAREWLDVYFSGKDPHFSLPIKLIGTEFQKEVWRIVSAIPYGSTTTYGEIAHQIAQKHNIERMSSQAVGCAVGRNNIAIIIPCHRVVGANGTLTGYAGGTERKRKLLLLEGVDVGIFSAKRKIMHNKI